jgi:citrate lyase beta subunit
MLSEYTPDAASFARVVGLSEASAHLPGGLRSPVTPALAERIYARVLDKLRREPVEDFRIDFEDGYGTRPDAEEDAHAEQAAAEVAAGMADHTLPPFIGIRVKNFGEGTVERGVRTLDLFLTTLSKLTGGTLPSNFVVMLPKVVSAQQVTTLVDLFELFESAGTLPRGSLQMEFMVETTQSVIDSTGKCPLPEFLRAARGRCIAAALGVYDYTASCSITAQEQRIDHDACDYARNAMQVSLGASGLYLADGATNIMPAPPHRSAEGKPLTPQQQTENCDTVHAAWKLHFQHVRRSLAHGFYQGWDLNPAQLPTRYAAVYSYFLESLDAATFRLRNFVDKAARATLAGDVFDDAATAQGLLTFFLQGLRRGAITEAEIAATGLSPDEMRQRSFAAIWANRAAKSR